MQFEIPPLILDFSTSISRSKVKPNIFVKPMLESKLEIQQLRANESHEKSQIHLPFQAIDAQLAPITQVNHGIHVSKRSISVESTRKFPRGQRILNLKDFESQERRSVRPQNRFDIEPISVLSYREQSTNNLNYSTVNQNLTQREKINDEEQEIETARRKANSYRSVPKAETIRLSTLQRSDIIKVAGSTSRERKKKDLSNLILPKIKRELIPRDLVFGPHVSQSVMKQHALSVAQGISYACKQVKPLSITQLRNKQISLAPIDENSKKTLLLDLDETLINARLVNIPNDKCFTVEVNGVQVKVMMRPYAIEFLEKMSKEFEIVIFTAAEKNYAESMIKLIDPEQKYIKHILYRDHCLKTVKGLFIKDLRIIKNRNLKDMILVDNFTPSFSFQIENGIPIITWDGDAKDQELKYLMKYLLEANKHDDVRVFNRERLRLKELAHIDSQKFANLQN